MVATSSLWRSLWWSMIIFSITLTLPGVVYAEEDTVGLNYTIKDPLGMETTFTYLNGQVDINCTYSGRCNDAKLNLKDEEFVTTKAPGKYVLSLSSSKSLEQGIWCYSSICKKNSSIMGGKFLMCNPYQPQPKNCSHGSFCIVDRGISKCSILNRNDCLVMPKDYYRTRRLKNYDLGCMIDVGIPITMSGLCHSYKDGHFADYISAGSGCYGLISFTLFVNKKGVQQLTTVFVDRRLMGGSFNIVLMIPVHSKYFNNRYCVIQGNMQQPMKVENNSQSNQSTIEISVAMLAKYGGPIFSAQCITIDEYSDQSLAVAFYIRLFDSSNVKAVVTDIKEGGQAGTLIGLQCTVATEPGLFVVVHWEGQSIDRAKKGQVGSATLMLTASNYAANRTYHCSYRIYGKSLPPYNDWKALFNGSTEPRIVLASELMEKTTTELAEETTTKGPTEKPKGLSTTAIVAISVTVTIVLILLIVIPIIVVLVIRLRRRAKAKTETPTAEMHDVQSYPEPEYEYADSYEDIDKTAGSQ